MAGFAEALAGLHQLHLSLFDVNEQLTRGPRQIAARDRKVKEARQQVEDLKAELKQCRSSADRKSLDLKTKEAKVNDLKAKLNVASTNREFDIIRGQIEADEVAKSVLEDEYFEFLEAADRLQVEIADAEQRVVQVEADRAEFEKKFVEVAEGLKQQAEELAASIQEGEKFLKGDDAVRYRRLVESMGAECMAAVNGGVCAGCFVSLTTQGTVLVNSGNVTFCHTCGRLLYQGQR
ncbi:MAG: hypothetical protein R3C01_08620 [Planctomycetaceae bacterium]